MTSVVAGHTPVRIWPALIRSSILTLNIHVETSKGTDCRSTAPPHDCFVLSFLSLPTKTTAFTEMLRWTLGWESCIFSGCWHLNKPLSSLLLHCGRQLNLCSVTKLLLTDYTLMDITWLSQKQNSKTSQR